MNLTIKNNRVWINFPDDIDIDEVAYKNELIFKDIGSARNPGLDIRNVSVALSWQNLRRLRQLGARVGDDEHTRDVIKKLRKELDVHNFEADVGDAVKRGHGIYGLPDYEFVLPPFEHQKIGWAFLHAVQNAALFGDCGTGKSQPFQTLTLTPGGWRPIGELAVGDRVYGRDGRPHRVTGVYPQGRRPVFRVTFNDGATTVADGEHLWLAKTFNDASRKRPWRVVSTQQMLDAGLIYGTSERRKRWRVPRVDPIQFPEKDLPLDPYVLGVLLGDGSLSGTPTWSKNDTEIVEEVEQRLPSGAWVSEIKSPERCRTWGITSGKNSHKNPVTEILQRLGLWGMRSWEKSIPEDYLWGSVDQRLELLRGLMDTDGTPGSTCSFSSTSEALANGVAFLAESLGGRVSKSDRTTHYTSKGEKKAGRRSYRIHFSLPEGYPPFRLKRKLDSTTPQRREIPRTIENIEPAGTEECVCISVDSPDATYVCERFIVTHNTYMVLTFIDSLIQARGGWAMIVICPVNLIKHVWIEDAAKFTPNLKVVSLREDKATSVIASDYDEKSDPKGLNRSERAALRAERRADPSWRNKARRRAQARHRKKLDERFAQAANVYVINPDNIREKTKEKRIIDLAKRLRKEGRRICLAVDESTMLKSHTSQTFRSIKRIREHAERCILMSGTPSPNGILDLWSQFKVLDDGLTLHSQFNDFRHEFAHEVPLGNLTWTDKRGRKHQATMWKPKRGSVARIHSLIEPRSVRFRTEDCIDLPPIRFIRRDVEMSKEQAIFYNAMENRLYAEIEGESVTARVAVAKLMKLREVTGGFVVTDSGDHTPFVKNPPKMAELDLLLAQSIDERLGDEGPPRKAIVWAQYRWECKTLVTRYAKKYGARGLFGGISSGDKDRAIDGFRRDPQAKLLVCHPASAGHGLTLTEANFAFYYSLDHNYELFYQSFRRISRPGQKRAMTFYFLVAPRTIDEELLSVIRNKKNMADAVTDGEISRDSFLEFRQEDAPSTWQPDLFHGD